MFSRLPGIGLDIGCYKTRLIWAKKKADGIQLVKYGSIHTPPGTIEGGSIVDPERLGEEIRKLVKELKLGGKSIVSAVGGTQIYMRNLIMPNFVRKELKISVYYQALKFLPIPLEEAAMDIFPLREIELDDGRQIELFFLAVRKQQVENLKLTCEKAGLKLAVVEIEPLALFRTLSAENETVAAILSVGFRRSHITVFKQGVPVLHRSINLGSSVFYSTLPLAGGISAGWGEASVLQEQPGRYLEPDLIREIKGAVEYYDLQSEGEGEVIKKIWLCGGEPNGGWEIPLSKGLGVEIEIANILPRLILPRHISHIEKRELQTDYQVALGLALREVL